MSATYQFIQTEAASQPVRTLCRALGASRSGYYAWAGREASVDELVPRVKDVFWRHSRRYGSRRITAELRAAGLSVGRRRVRRVMREQGLQAMGAPKLCPTHD